MGNIVQKAKICNSKIEEGYTFMLGLDILDENGDYDFSQGFSGRKFQNYEDYQFWKNAIENIADRRFEDINGATIQAIVTPAIILGIGNTNGKYWIVREENDVKVKSTKDEINKFFGENQIEILETSRVDKERER